MNTTRPGGGELGGPIQIEAGGQAIPPEDLEAEEEAAVQVLLGLQPTPERRPGGVVDPEQEGGFFGAKPVVQGAVQKKQLAGAAGPPPLAPEA